ncbi:glycosyltransferase family A protein [Priestia taiwanensis]|uniref:glycosyltransferase family A protein n=1 Tax=Priestia taiwanensis TaxID=1347902 RepID=UPI0030B83046
MLTNPPQLSNNYKTKLRYHSLYFQKNSGVAVARNTATEHATEEYVAFLDSDDLWHPTKIGKQIKTSTPPT